MAKIPNIVWNIRILNFGFVSDFEIRTSDLKRRIVPLRFILFLSLFCSAFLPSAFANVLSNSSFEDAIGSGAGNWDSTNGAILVNTATMPAGFTVPPPAGSFALRLNSANGNYTFQVADGVKPGDFVTFSAQVESSVANAARGGRMCIEFKWVFDDGSGDSELSETCSALINNTGAANTINASNGNGYVRVSVHAKAPERTERAVFVLKTENNDVAGFVVFDDATAEINPSKLTAAVSKSRAKAGDILTVIAKYTNDVGATFQNVEFRAEIPRGFSLLRDSVTLDGGRGTFREGSLIMPLGTITGFDTKMITFQLAVTSGVTPGKTYEIPLVIHSFQNDLSEQTQLKVVIEEDPVFDQGTIVGKVYNDQNKNGVQDAGEKGVPWVKLATEEGIMIVTDEYGRYHIPAVKPGRHLIKIDGHSLPEGTEFVTEESLLVKTTPGILNKASFAVYIPESAMPQEFEDLTVGITQGLDTSRPVLAAEIEPKAVRLGIDRLEEEAVFRFRINYAEFVRHWFLEIRDEQGNEVWTGYGVSEPPQEVAWAGQTESGLLIKEGIYSYQLKVEDKDGHQDWSPLYFFRVVSKMDPHWDEKVEEGLPVVGDFNIFKDGKQSIPLVAKPTLRIQGKTKPGYKVHINRYPVKVDPMTGNFQTEIYTSPGEKEIGVVTTSPEGESTSYVRKVRVKDSTFFMVALGEEQLGVNFQGGEVETAGDEGEFKDGFYEDGRLSYYLKGKIKGKVLVHSHYDTEDRRSALFTNLDPDDYYPVYGDASTRDYQAQDSLDKFYILLEMDRSFVKWGSFKTAFTDTELASYNRTLSGLKASYETVGATAYGDPKRGVKIFSSDASHRGDHNEFAATSGSLYYLRNRNVVEGSEKVRVVVRDKIQNMDKTSRDLIEGQDYEIDYDQGRIFLTHPLSYYAQPDVNFSDDLWNGDPVFLVVDYEYDQGFNIAETTNRGIRGFTHMGEHLRIGGTAVEEDRNAKGEYNLRGVDATLKLGRNTKISAEYATSRLEQVSNSVSYNGGLTFAVLPLLRGQNTRPRENAYLVRAESKPVKNLEVSGYVQDSEPGFSNDHLRSQEGTKKFGTSTKYKLHKNLYARHRFDHSEVVGQLMPLSEHGISSPYETLETNVGQAGYDDGLWMGEAEYMHRETDLPQLGNLVPSLISEVPFENAISLKTGRRLNEKMLPYAKVQTSIHGKANHQFGGGFRYKLKRDVYAYLEQMVGTIGDSTVFGFEKQYEQGVKSYANFNMWDLGPGLQSMTTTLGNAFTLSPKSRIYSERVHSSYQSLEGYTEALGLNHRLTEQWDFDTRFERRHLNGHNTRLIDRQAEASLARTNTFNTASFGVGYNDKKKLKARIFVEARRDQDAPKVRQWVSRNYLEYKYSDSLSFRSNFTYGNSHFMDPSDNAADFTEFNTGFAYRPVDHDRFHWLGRYTYVRDIGNDFQFTSNLFQGIELDESAHIFATDIAYDVTARVTMVEKLAYKTATYDTSVSEGATLNSFLWAHRMNYHVTKKWDVALEYRILWQSDSVDTLRHGALAEVDREVYDYVRLGLGYNFTDFNDDLRKLNNFDSHGPFMRMTGKF